MQLKDIQYVVTVARESSFSRAAQILFVSQPALSQSIKRLENKLGVPLFIREGKTVKLTSAGEIFVADGIEILRMSSALKKKMSDIINLKDCHLKIGISTFYSNCYLPRIIPSFQRQYPSVHLEIIEESSNVLEELAHNGEVDFCMIPGPLDNKQLDSQILCQEQILMALPPNHHLNKQLTPALSSGLPFIDLALLKDEPFIFLKKHQKFTKIGLQLCQNAGFAPNIVFETGNWNTIHSLVSTGLGLGFIPEILTEVPIAGQRPVYYRIMADNTARPYLIAYKKEKPLSTTALDFIKTAKESFMSQ